MACWLYVNFETERERDIQRGESTLSQSSHDFFGGSESHQRTADKAKANGSDGLISLLLCLRNLARSLSVPVKQSHSIWQPQTFSSQLRVTRHPPTCTDSVQWIFTNDLLWQQKRGHSKMTHDQLSWLLARIDLSIFGAVYSGLNLEDFSMLVSNRNPCVNKSLSILPMFSGQTWVTEMVIWLWLWAKANRTKKFWKGQKKHITQTTSTMTTPAMTARWSE